MEHPLQVEKDSHDISCPNCGAELVYQPGTTKLACEYCGSSFAISIPEGAQREAAARENDLQSALSNWAAAQTLEKAYVVTCASCGAQTSLPENLFSDRCAFCGSPITVKPNEESLARPQGLLPFKLEKAAASASFKKWLDSLWFAPNDLAKTALQQNFNGVYIPYWTFDAKTYTQYVGQRGDYYYETHRVRRDGKVVEERVRKTRWSFVNGSLQHTFDDLLIAASKSLPGKYINILEPWDLDALIPYDNRYFSGYQAEVCQIDIRDGFQIARQGMDAKIRRDIIRQIGGDIQRIMNLQTAISDTTYKYLLLPVWLSVYRYQGKSYQFVVNARTGEVHGDRPWSWVKILLAVLCVLFLLWMLFMLSGSQ
jgi:DNA-directed RNA polymerase subunit RPC12/RpoP